MNVSSINMGEITLKNVRFIGQEEEQRTGVVATNTPTYFSKIT